MNDTRLRTLGQRLVCCEAPEAVPDAVRIGYSKEIARRLMAPEGSVPWLTLPKAIQENQDMLAVASGQDAELLRGVLHYLIGRAEEAATVLELTPTF